MTVSSDVSENIQQDLNPRPAEGRASEPLSACMKVALLSLDFQRRKTYFWTLKSNPLSVNTKAQF